MSLVVRGEILCGLMIVRRRHNTDHNGSTTARREDTSSLTRTVLTPTRQQFTTKSVRRARRPFSLCPPMSLPCNEFLQGGRWA